MSIRIAKDLRADFISASSTLRLPVLPEVPSTGTEGSLAYILSRKAVYVFNGSSWIPVSGSGVAFSGGVIDAPGTYSLDKDIHVASGECGITIGADNVTVLLGNHKIILDDAANQTTGICATGVRNVTILGGAIESGAGQSASSNDNYIYAPADYNWGISLIDVTGFTVAGVELLDLGVSLDVQNCSNGDVTNNSFIVNPHSPATASVGSLLTIGGNYTTKTGFSANISIANNKYKSVTYDNFWLGAINVGYRVDTVNSQNISLLDNSMSNSDIFMCATDGFLINNNSLVIDDSTYIYSGMQLGATGKTLIGEQNRKFVNGGIITGSSFVQTAGSVGTTTVNVACASGIVMDGCVVQQSGIASGSISSGFFIAGNASPTYAPLVSVTPGPPLLASPFVKQLTVKNCNIQTIGLGIVPLCTAPFTNETIFFDNCIIKWDQNGTTLDLGDNVACRLDLATNQTQKSVIRNCIVSGTPNSTVTVLGAGNTASGNISI